MNEQNNSAPIETILNEFVKYKKGSAKKSAKQYRQVVNAFAVDDIFVPKSNETKEQIKANVSKNLLDLLPKIIANAKYKKNTNEWTIKIDDEGKNISDIIGWGNDYNLNFQWDDSKKSYKTYLKHFFDFIGVVFEKKQEFEKIFIDCNGSKFTPSDIAIFKGVRGDIYLHNLLFTKFKSRLRCQDRTSGDKIWLPLRFIAKIYSKAKKKETIKDNVFLKWLDKLVNDIYIHYEDEDNGYVKSVPFGGNEDKKDVHLRLVPNDDAEYDVYVRWTKKDEIVERRVLTPTGRGNEKCKMVVKGINEIAIDHVKPIDQTLREHESEFSALKTVSDVYKKLQEDEDSNEEDAVNRLLKDCNIFNKLINDLELISKDSVLRLMASKYNAQKSNGSTFKKILKVGEKNYYGIMEENISADEVSCLEGKEFVLYQKLDNILDNSGKLQIREDIPVDAIETSDLESIINYI